MQITSIIARGNTKGVLLADGAIMLSRQGCGPTTNGLFHGAYVEASLGHAHVSARFSHQSTGDIPKTRHGQYPVHCSEKRAGHFPWEMRQDARNFIEEQTGVRPTAFLDQVHAYMFDGGRQKSDILLSPLRYDSAAAAVIHADDDAVVARHAAGPQAIAAGAFNVTEVEITTEDSTIRAAIEKALGTGFHSCDSKRGADYCMRRLTWLAGCYYDEARCGDAIAAYVLCSDIETPSALGEGAQVTRFDDFSQSERYNVPVHTRLVLALPTTPYRPEAMRVTERKSGDSCWYEVETFSTNLNRWIAQKNHCKEAAARADALGWYPRNPAHA